MFTLKKFLLSYHGKLNRILLSYSKTDSPISLGKEYDKWFEETNKNIEVDIDLQHTTKKLEDFEQILPYINLEVCSWNLFYKNEETILEVSLQ